MNLRAQRFAGARLAAQPLQSIPQELQDALIKLREANKLVVAQPVTEDFPDYIGKYRDVPRSTKKIHLMADPGRVRLENIIPDDLSKTPANIDVLEQLVANPPRAVYDLSWDVDGSYTPGANTGPKEKMRIAREVERGWQEIIPQMEEGALVKNMPLGAMDGNFERADIYMKYGFGPVQANGQQYGQVVGGKIVPISPTMPDTGHMAHLAERAKSGGETELAAQLNANAQSLQDLTKNIQVMNTKDEISGNRQYEADYDDYDYDVDYEPPITIDDQRTREENEAFVGRRFAALQQTPGPNPAISLRSTAKSSVDPLYLVSPEGDAPTASNVQRLRDAQLELNRSTEANRPLEVVNEALPRPVPRMLSTTPERPERFRGSAYNPNAAFRALPTNERRELLGERLRDQAERTTYSERDPLANAIAARAAGKDTMIDMQRPFDNGVGRVMQERYTDSDVADLRRLQEAYAADSMNPELANVQATFNDDNYVSPVSSRPNERFVQTGDRIVNRRALNTEQQAAQDALEPYTRAREDIGGALTIFEQSQRGPGLAPRQIRRARNGVTTEQLMQGIQPNPGMPGRQALEILQAENAQPGSQEHAQLGQALVNLNQIRDRNYRAVQAGASDQVRIVEEANRGPMAPIQRVDESRLNRPNLPWLVEQPQRPRRPSLGTSSYDEIPF